MSILDERVIRHREQTDCYESEQLCVFLVQEQWLYSIVKHLVSIELGSVFLLKI